MQKRTLILGAMLMAMMVAWVGGGTPLALAQRAGVPQTGQTECWDAAGSPINCTGTGQDGDSQAGVSLPNPRFRDRLDGTVEDKLTGLIWLQQANCPTLPPTDWSTALTRANQLAHGHCGLTDKSKPGDWRLPNVRELVSLMDFGFAFPALSNAAGTGQWTEGNAFILAGVHTGGGFYTSTTYEAEPSRAWVVYVHDGHTTDLPKSPGPLGVWPVRGGK